MKKISDQLQDIISVAATKQHLDIDESLEHRYSTENKSHRNRLSRLDHWLEYLLHPFCLIILLALFFCSFCIAHFIGIYYNCEAAKALAAHLWNAASYASCAVITHLITVLIEKKKNTTEIRHSN
ncbi:MAG: hypothetical protein LBT05_15430 [Planctomycetaceae bacterium]|jgi:hypothetical protein|nr:hypothetical protein [Planctomycetaceae bacterium]